MRILSVKKVVFRYLSRTTTPSRKRDLSLRVREAEEQMSAKVLSEEGATDSKVRIEQLARLTTGCGTEFIVTSGRGVLPLRPP
ncbi:hypothetical protein CDAR_572781 [Caerostris darwini]|uniref:Uncharacterized protein n=1 Tax=Caerostris darwini TaxID=1538125 RepID=A0AAV4W775_9ARAC|nr:hypothetical protein CDAR_572781 [Caerostris darwini]